MKTLKVVTLAKLNRKHFLLIFVLGFVIINIFTLGGSDFVTNLNNFVTIVLITGIAYLSIGYWYRLPAHTNPRSIFLSLSLGYTLWAIAEVWWGVASLIGSEVPFPSWADVFWVLGYIPLYLAFWLRIRSLPIINGWKQKTGYGLSIIITLGFVILFILVPILQDFEPAFLVESILSFLYPAANLILVLLVMRIFFTYQKGRYGYAWAWLVFGFGLTSFSDMLFTYASLFDLYYPGGQSNLISSLGVDVSYNLGYLCQLIAFIVLKSIEKEYKAIPETIPQMPPLPNTHLLIFTLKNDLIFSVSDQYARVFPGEPFQGKTIAEGIGSQPQDINNFLRNLKEAELLQEQPITVMTHKGRLKAGISGIVIKNPQDEYSGVTLLVRLSFQDENLDRLMSDYQQEMVKYMLSRTGGNDVEEKKELLVAYYQVLFRAYYNRVIYEGGAIMADAFISELDHFVKQNGWQIRFQTNMEIDAKTISLPVLIMALPALLDTAKHFVTKTLDPGSERKIMEDAMSHFDETIRKKISNLEIGLFTIENS